MKVLVDADGCPVVDIAVRLCKQFAVPCLLLCDTAHLLHREGSETITVDKGADNVDFALVNRVAPGDLVITQDYGLASMCLARGAKALHQDGWSYNAGNMDALLFQRHASAILRRSGGRMKGTKKRTQAQDKSFALALENMLQTAVQG